MMGLVGSLFEDVRFKLQTIQQISHLIWRSMLTHCRSALQLEGRNQNEQAGAEKLDQ